MCHLPLNALGLADLPIISGLNLRPVAEDPNKPVILHKTGFLALISVFFSRYEYCGNDLYWNPVSSKLRIIVSI